MDLWSQWIVPGVILLGRVAAFVMVLPLFGWTMLPTVVRSGLAVLLTAFFAWVGPIPAVRADAHWLALGGLLIREILLGLVLGLAVSFVFQAVRQAGHVVSQLMGLSDAGIIDPLTGEPVEAMDAFFEMTFALLFLVAGGHQVLLAVLHRSYQAFPVGAMPQAGSLAETLIQSGADMLGLSLRVAAPLLAAFVVLSVALAVLARAMPEVNILYLSFPLRTGLCILVASGMMPLLNSFAGELGQWLRGFFAA